MSYEVVADTCYVHVMQRRVAVVSLPLREWSCRTDERGRRLWSSRARTQEELLLWTAALRRELGHAGPGSLLECIARASPGRGDTERSRLRRGRHRVAA
jgi:hypothetical protein